MPNVITVSSIESRIASLRYDIDQERNTKEKARLVDEQAALKLTLRVMPTCEMPRRVPTPLAASVKA